MLGKMYRYIMPRNFIPIKLTWNKSLPGIRINVPSKMRARFLSVSRALLSFMSLPINERRRETRSL